MVIYGPIRERLFLASQSWKDEVKVLKETITEKFSHLARSLLHLFILNFFILYWGIAN